MSAPPVDPRDFPDPFVLASGGTYYAFATNSGAINVQVMSSADLVHWQAQPDALPILPGWAVRGNTWAPVVLATADGFALFYAAREPTAGRQAISLAMSHDPGGPYVDTSTSPLIYQLELGGSIDPSPFVDTDGTAYLLWKADSNAINQPSSLWIQALDDGPELAGQPTRLLSMDQSWEHPLIEAPSLTYDDGTYYLFYSANWWNTAHYAIGYATATTVLGPYTKITTSGPWFGADANVAGPGGQEWFSDANGLLHMAYHGWQPGQIGYPGGVRSLRLARVKLSAGPPSAT